MNLQKPFISTKPALSTKPTHGTAKTAVMRDATAANVPVDPNGFPSTGVIFGPAVCPIAMPTSPPTPSQPIVNPTNPIVVNPVVPPTIVFPAETVPPVTVPPTGLPTLPIPLPTIPPVTLPPAGVVPPVLLPPITFPPIVVPPVAVPPATALPGMPVVPTNTTNLVVPFTPTPQVFIDEFYNHLQFLHTFFLKQNKKYWITGGTLLGQVRGQKIINWDTNNDIGVLIANETEGEKMFQDIRSYIAANNVKDKFDVWRSTHGLKLISKQLAHIGTDIYFYRKADDKAVLMRERSQMQWPNDYFELIEIGNEVVPLPFGPIIVYVPKNPLRYVKTMYGNNALTHARLGSFDHFTNRPRVGPKGNFALFQ